MTTTLYFVPSTTHDISVMHYVLWNGAWMKDERFTRSLIMSNNLES